MLLTMLHKYLFEIPLSHELITSLLFFFIFSKNLKRKQFPYQYILELPTFYGCLMGLDIKEVTRERQGAQMSNHCQISHR